MRLFAQLVEKKKMEGLPQLLGAAKAQYWKVLER